MPLLATAAVHTDSRAARLTHRIPPRLLYGLTLCLPITGSAATLQRLLSHSCRPSPEYLHKNTHNKGTRCEKKKGYTHSSRYSKRQQTDRATRQGRTPHHTHLAVLVEDGEAVAGQEHGREAGASPQLVRVRAGPAGAAVHAAEGQELVAPAVAVVGHLHTRQDTM